METPQLKINASFDKEVNEGTIRLGEAQPIIVARRIALDGVITAPADWLEQKSEAGYSFREDYCHAVINRDNLTIKFTSNDEEGEAGGHTITGRLRPDTSLDALHINATSHTYTAKQLGSLLKMNRSLFADRDENMRIVTALQNFVAKVTQTVEKNDDLKGNVLHHFEREVKSEFNLTFSLTAPLYKREEKATFKVEIRFDVRDAAVTYWLESVELKDLQDEQRDIIMDREAERFADRKVPVIEQ